MNSFENYKNIIIQKLQDFQKEAQPPSLKEQINYFLSLGGKRLRPSLLLAACDLFGGEIEQAVNPALGIELFHNFTLMHDDVMDEAPLRRNKETVHKKWNVSTAILAGDAMYASSFHYMSMVERNILPEILNLFSKTAIQVCEGQQLDMLFEKQDDVSIDDYINMIRLKTAVLLACSLKAGAIIAGAQKEDQENIYDFGINIGIGFQLQDDILDVYGEQEKFGKKPGGDIMSGKKTFLLLKALELANELDYIKLKSINRNENTVAEIVGIYNKLDIKKYSKDYMEMYFKKSLECLDNLSVQKDKIKPFLMFAEEMITREI